MLPVVLKTDGAEAPDTPVYHQVAANGVFEVRHTPIYRSITRFYGDLPGLEAENESVELLAPRLPAALMEEVVAFFGHVFRVCDAEAVVVLFFDPERSRYRFEVPRQTVSMFRRSDGRWATELSVRYQNVARPEGYLRCGSIHSHAELSAHASHVDCSDERYEDGLHLVVGHLDRQKLSLSAAITVAGARFGLAVADVVEPFDQRSALRSTEDAWLARVHVDLFHGKEKTRTTAMLWQETAARELASDRGGIAEPE